MSVEENRTKKDIAVEVNEGSGMNRSKEREGAEEVSGDSTKDGGTEQTADTTSTGQPDYPKGIKFVLLTISLMLVLFILALDTTIISTAIPKMTTRFQSIDDIGWYQSAYLLPLMSLQPTFGKIYSFFAIKPIFIAAMVVFEVGSVVCATAPTSYAFIIGRVVAGIGAAAMYAGGMVIITTAVPLPKLSLYLAMLSSMLAVASLTGPPLGGVFTDSARLTWRFCFWINLPFGSIALLAFLAIYQEPAKSATATPLTTKQKLLKLDIGGTILFITSIILLFIALQFGGTTYPWSNPRVIVLFILSGLCLTLFAILQFHLKEDATIPPHLLTTRSLPLSLLAAALTNLTTTTHIFYLPFYLQTVLLHTASESGLLLLPYTILVTVTELIVGISSSLLATFLPFMYFGTTILTIAAGLFTTLDLSTPVARIIGFEVLAALGLGSCLQLCSTSVRAAVTDKKDIPTAATLSVFAPFFGSALGAAVNQNVFRVALRGELFGTLKNEEEVERIVREGGAGTTGGDGGWFEELGVEGRLGVREAYNGALWRVWVVGCVAAGLAVGAVALIKWRTLKEGDGEKQESEMSEGVLVEDKGEVGGGKGEKV